MSGDGAAQLQQRAADVLAKYVDVGTAEDGSLSFDYAGALCSVTAVHLSDGLDVLSMTCVLAWDRPISATLHKKVAERNGAVQFGSISAFGHGRYLDVVLRYAFPAAGLDEDALTTMLLLVLAGADTARQGLVP
ncbi:hypothetical protein G4H71_01515 [Rhodococcus triatomae]|uniref:Sensory transduction regulator n=1 Tax=Rhodococcus triatomae TaxID=300028 RepID=A0A1G8DIH3_9NOCA|nr:hypothetical protein [Rhodococcus triatomae]QNG18427.1 hypothetical protein G4H72_06535 [Rhodococcus triatomae]QNG21903.1 hypothetical protein G4H71_01515 [Rhodococcus triatomae]SDH57259.1 hypothetical protein SAMN05444695_102310 [Rhodococcus triatomae]